MTVIQLVLAIAADIRARDYGKLLTDFIALLQLVAGPGAATAAVAGMKGATATTVSVACQPDPDDLAAELEAFAHAHPLQAGASAGAAAAVNWRGLIELLLKVLPLILSKP